MNIRSVLIVDDDDGFRDNLKDILEDHKYEVLCTSTCSEAMKLAKELKPAAALLDIRLPDGSGTTLLGDLKKINNDCVCTMMTAFADLQTALMAIELGAFHYLQKPFQPLELLNLLEKIFENIQLRQEKTEAEKALRQSESTVRSLLDAFPFAAVLVDLTGKIITANRYAAGLLGKKRDEMISVDYSELTSREAYEKRKQKFQEVIRIGMTMRFEEKEKEKILDTIISPILTEAGEVKCLAMFSRDVTDAKQSEEERRKLELNLAHAQRMEAIGTLAGGIAHDFNNLLQSILGFTEIVLLDKEKDDREFRMLKNVKEAAQTASTLTRQLLTFSRKADKELMPTDLNVVLKHAEELLRRTIPKMIDIELQFANNLFIINSDSTQMEQVMLNLVLNSRDAMPDGGKVIIETSNITLDDTFCKSTPGCLPGDYVLLTVTDTGEGMDQETINHIFDPFFTTKESGKGTGLGLAMVFGIVKSHRGHIVCESKPGMGAKFKIYLPAIQKQTLNISADFEDTDDSSLRGSETILVVDDEDTIRVFIAQFLTRFGYTVLSAESGEKALDIYENNKHSISLVMLDLIMPGMGGKHCMKELLQKNPALKVIILSGFTGEDSIALLLEEGARGFVTKPFNIKNILKEIRNTLDSQS
jgi:two-component system, cell cycle sensor histidine kinase and response regulator CckA